MPLKPYTLTEIFEYFDQINCIEDIQVIADYLCENCHLYSASDFDTLKKSLMFYAGLWV